MNHANNHVPIKIFTVLPDLWPDFVSSKWLTMLFILDKIVLFIRFMISHSQQHKQVMPTETHGIDWEKKDT